jgi:hypothetical protein
MRITRGWYPETSSVSHSTSLLGMFQITNPTPRIRDGAPEEGLGQGKRFNMSTLPPYNKSTSSTDKVTMMMSWSLISTLKRMIKTGWSHPSLSAKRARNRSQWRIKEITRTSMVTPKEGIYPVKVTHRPWIRTWRNIWLRATTREPKRIACGLSRTSYNSLSISPTTAESLRRKISIQWYLRLVSNRIYYFSIELEIPNTREV